MCHSKDVCEGEKKISSPEGYRDFFPRGMKFSFHPRKHPLNNIAVIPVILEVNKHKGHRFTLKINVCDSD